MSRATSGLLISTDNSERRFSRADMSASTVSGSRGFLMTLTRDELPAGVACAVQPLPRFDSRASARTDFRLPPSECAVVLGNIDSSFSDGELPATADGSDFVAFQS